MLNAYFTSRTAVPPGARGEASSTYIMVSSTRHLSGVALPVVFGAVFVFAGFGEPTDSVMLSTSNPPWNPALPNRLSEAKRRDPVLPGRKRFWSTCIQTYRRVSGEWFV